MTAPKWNAPQFIVDENGKRLAVLLDLKHYGELLEAAEELDDIKAYDHAETEGGDYIPYEQAVREIEDARQ